MTNRAGRYRAGWREHPQRVPSLAPGEEESPIRSLIAIQDHKGPLLLRQWYPTASPAWPPPMITVSTFSEPPLLAIAMPPTDLISGRLSLI